MASEESEVDDDFKPMDLEQRRYNMWSNNLNTPGMEFAQEMKRRAEEEKKFTSDKTNDQEQNDSSSSSSSSSESSEESESNKSNEKVKEEIAEQTLIKKESEEESSSDSISNSDKEIENKANMKIKRAKFQGAVERFVKKIGYGGKKSIEEKYKERFKSMFKDRILEILKRNKYFESARETLPKRAKQLEKIVSLKKDVKFVDICRNIECNVKEMATSKQISRMFILGKLPVNFLLLKPERFCDKKDRIIGRLTEKLQDSKIKPLINIMPQTNPEVEIKEEAKENKPPSKVQSKSIISVLNDINKKNELKFEQDFKDRQERIKKKIAIQQKMGIVRPINDNLTHVQYPSYGDADQQMHYNSENHYDQYREYDPYIDSAANQYNPYQVGGIKTEFMNQPNNQQNMQLMHHQYPYDPRYPQNIACGPMQANPEYPNNQPVPQNNEEGDEYDPLQNY